MVNLMSFIVMLSMNGKLNIFHNDVEPFSHGIKLIFLEHCNAKI